MSERVVPAKDDLDLGAGRAVLAWDSDQATFGIIGVDAIIVVLATPNAEPILRRLDLLNVEATLVCSWEDTEGIRGNTVVSLAGRIELTTLIRRIQATEVRGVDTSGDLVDLVLVRGTRDGVKRLTRNEPV